MTMLTLVIFVVMAVNFRRWRKDYCGRRELNTPEDPDSSDATSIVSLSDLPRQEDTEIYANEGFEDIVTDTTEEQSIVVHLWYLTL